MAFATLKLGFDEYKLIKLDTPCPELHSHTCHNTMEDVEHMKKILEDDPSLLHCPVKWSSVFTVSMPLHEAAFRLHDKCVDFMLSRGADINALASVRDHVIPNCNVMQCAITSPFNEKSKRQYNVIKLLLNHGASPNNIFNLDFKNTFFIEHCILFHMNDILKLLLEYGAETRVKENIHAKVDLGTPLAKCILSWNVEGLKLLLLNNAKDMLFNYEMINPGSDEIVNWKITSVVHMIAVEAGYQHLKEHNNEKEQKNILKLAIKFFEIYKAFRGSLWEVQHQLSCSMCCHNIYENVVEYLQHRTPYPCEFDDGEFLLNIKELMYNPPSLKSLARIAVQESMDQSYVKNIPQLEVPEELKEYLLYDELDTSEIKSESIWRVAQINLFDIIDHLNHLQLEHAEEEDNEEEEEEESSEEEEESNEGKEVSNEGEEDENLWEKNDLLDLD